MAEKHQNLKATALLKRDHTRVKQLFAQFEAAGPGSEDRQALIEQITQELRMHSRIEKELFYPALREAMPRAARDIVGEAIEEHGLLEYQLGEIQSLAADDPRLEPKMAVLIKNARQHFRDEENEIFGEARKRFSEDRLRQIGSEMQTFKLSIERPIGAPPEPLAPAIHPGA